MRSRLISVLPVVFLTCCHEKSSAPPAALRLHVTSDSILDGEFPLPADTPKFIEWLSGEIERKAVHPDVRLDFDPEVPAWRMAEITEAVFGAGAHTSEYDLAYGVDGWSGGDFLMVPPMARSEYYSCAVKEIRRMPDDWGEFTVLELGSGPQVVFDLTMEEGSLYAGDLGVDTDTGMLEKLLQQRGKSGPVHVTIYTDAATTAGDLLASLIVCHDSGAEVNIATEKQEEKSHKDEQLMRRRMTYLLPDFRVLFHECCSYFGRRPYVGPVILPGSGEPVKSPPWLPERFEMGAETLTEIVARERQIYGSAGDGGPGYRERSKSH